MNLSRGNMGARLCSTRHTQYIPLTISAGMQRNINKNADNKNADNATTVLITPIGDRHCKKYTSYNGNHLASVYCKQSSSPICPHNLYVFRVGVGVATTNGPLAIHAQSNDIINLPAHISDVDVHAGRFIDIKGLPCHLQ